MIFHIISRQHPEIFLNNFKLRSVSIKNQLLKSNSTTCSLKQTTPGLRNKDRSTILIKPEILFWLPISLLRAIFRGRACCLSKHYRCFKLKKNAEKLTKVNNFSAKNENWIWLWHLNQANSVLFLIAIWFLNNITVYFSLLWTSDFFLMELNPSFKFCLELILWEFPFIKLK